MSVSDLKTRTKSKKTASPEQTPMMAHYLSIKKNYPNYFLFYRMGDFYELFFDDAVRASKCLDITLTSRSKSADPNIPSIPMAGVPHHALENYLTRLIQAGYSVVICDQVPPSPQSLENQNTKTLIERKVTRILTPGTITDECLLQHKQKQDNWIACCFTTPNHALKTGTYGLAWLELTTGRFLIEPCQNLGAVFHRLTQIQCSECLIPKNFKSHPDFLIQIELLPNIQWTSREYWHFDLESSETRLKKQFQSQTLSGFGLTDHPLCLQAAGCLLDYLQHTQQSELPHIRSLKHYQPQKFLILDPSTQSHLELSELFKILDHCQTHMGARQLKRWLQSPIRDPQSLTARYDTIQILQNNILTEYLKPLPDLERILSRIALQSARPHDLVRLKNTLQALPNLKNKLISISTLPSDQPDSHPEHLLDILNTELHGLPDLYAELNSALSDTPNLSNTIRDGHIFKTGYDRELDHYRALTEHSDQALAEFEQNTQTLTGMANLKLGYNRIQGYYFECSKLQAELHAKQLSQNLIRTQTLKNMERFTTPELKAFETKLLSAQQQALYREKQLYHNLLIKITEQYLSQLQITAHAISTLDVLNSLAITAKQDQWIQPTLVPERTLNIQSGRHAVLGYQKAFTANHTDFDPDQTRFLILTGPNMGGKSTYMRQIALIVILAHIGSWVPAEQATLGPIDQIFTRIGASDDLLSGRSTFMVEMSETAYILNHATQYSLILLDEIGRGTSTTDGVSIAWGVSEYLIETIQAFTLFATHYFELTELAKQYTATQNVHVSAIEHRDQIVFLHEIKPGPTDQSYGLQVAKLSGVPKVVLEKAEKKKLELI